VSSSSVFQFKPCTQYRHVGLLKPNCFGEYLFDNDKEKVLTKLKKQSEVYYENKAVTMGTSKTQLMREDRWPLAEPKVYDGRNDKNSRQQSNRGNPGLGNGRASSREFCGGGRFNSRNRGFKIGRGSNFPKTSNQQWSENANEQSGQQSGQSNRNQSRGNKRNWGGKGGGKGGNQ
jgi:hypothetical protein